MALKEVENTSYNFAQMTSQTSTLSPLMIFAMFVIGIRPTGPQKGQNIYKHDKYDPDYGHDVTEVCQLSDSSPVTSSLLD